MGLYSNNFNPFYNDVRNVTLFRLFFVTTQNTRFIKLISYTSINKFIPSASSYKISITISIFGRI